MVMAELNKASSGSDGDSVPIWLSDFKDELAELRDNSKPRINMLTMLADENTSNPSTSDRHAQMIVDVVEQHIMQQSSQVPARIKLCALYLLDSICKNCSSKPFRQLFARNVPSLFVHIFKSGDEKLRASMYRLRQTWNDLFAASKLYAIDFKTHEIDPAWPVVLNMSGGGDSQPQPTQQQGTIHVNPKFLTQGSGHSKSPTAAPAVTAANSSTSSTLVDANRDKVLAKNREEELRKLQERRVELEMMQAKARIDEKRSQQMAVAQTQHALTQQAYEFRKQQIAIERDPRRNRPSATSTSAPSTTLATTPSGTARPSSVVTVPAQSKLVAVKQEPLDPPAVVVEKSKKKSEKDKRGDGSSSVRKRKQRVASSGVGLEEEAAESSDEDRRSNSKSSSGGTKSASKDSSKKGNGNVLNSRIKTEPSSRSSPQPSQQQRSYRKRNRNDDDDNANGKQKTSASLSTTAADKTATPPAPSAKSLDKDSRLLPIKKRKHIGSVGSDTVPDDGGESSRGESESDTPSVGASTVFVESDSGGVVSTGVFGSAHDLDMRATFPQQQTLPIAEDQLQSRSQVRNEFGGRGRVGRGRQRGERSSFVERAPLQQWHRFEGVPQRPPRAGRFPMTRDDRFRQSRGFEPSRGVYKIAQTPLPRPPHMQTGFGQGGAANAPSFRHGGLIAPPVGSRNYSDPFISGSGAVDMPASVPFAPYNGPAAIMPLTNVSGGPGFFPVTQQPQLPILPTLPQQLAAAPQTDIAAPAAGSFLEQSNPVVLEQIEADEHPDEQEVAISPVDDTEQPDVIDIRTGSPTPQHSVDHKKGVAPIPPNKMIFVDGRAYEVQYVRDVPVIERNGLPHHIRFVGTPREIVIDGEPHTLAFGETKQIIIDGQCHSIRYGGPSRELYLGSQPLRGSFGGPAIHIRINGRDHRIQLIGQPPEVKIDPDPDYELLKYMRNTTASSQHSATPTTAPTAVRQAAAPSKVAVIEQPRGYNLPEIRPRYPMPHQQQNYQQQTVAHGYQQGMPNMPSSASMMHYQQQQMHAMAPGYHLSPGYPQQQQHMPINTYIPTQQLQPGQQTSAVPNVNELLSKLIQKGFINPNASSSPGRGAVVGGREMTPPGAASQKGKFTGPRSIICIDDILERREQPSSLLRQFTIKDMKIRYSKPIASLYSDGLQCSSCGQRFPETAQAAYSRHLDWHFQLNRRQKSQLDQARRRNWYLVAEDWIGYDEMGAEAASKARSAITERDEANASPAGAHAQTATVGSISATTESVIPASKSPQQECAMCGEKFEQFWDEDADEWMMRNAQEINGKVYHPLCYQDVSHDSASVPSTPLSTIASVTLSAAAADDVAAGSSSGAAVAAESRGTAADNAMPSRDSSMDRDRTAADSRVPLGAVGDDVAIKPLIDAQSAINDENERLQQPVPPPGDSTPVHDEAE